MSDAPDCFVAAVIVGALRIADEEAVCHVTMNRNDRCNVFLMNWNHEYFLHLVTIGLKKSLKSYLKLPFFWFFFGCGRRPRYEVTAENMKNYGMTP